MTLNERKTLQRKILLRHYDAILEKPEKEQFKNKMAKSVYSLLGSLMWIPYVGYQLVNFRKPGGDSLAKRSKLRTAMLCQIVFSALNWRWSN